MAYLDKSTYLLVDDQKKIAWKYASTWLLFDVISTIPTELARKISPKPFRSYGFFNMLRLWRLRRVSALFSRYGVLFIPVASNCKQHDENWFFFSFLSCGLGDAIFSVLTFHCSCSNRLEKDRNYNYFWVRCAKLICVSISDDPEIVYMRKIHFLCCTILLGFGCSFCRSPCLRFTLLDASITFLQHVTVTPRTHGLGQQWKTSFSKVCGFDM